VDIMTPANPRWVEFCLRLQGPEGINSTQTDPDDVNTLRWTCFGGLEDSFASRILERMGLTPAEVTLSLRYFLDHGAGCDCEILWNVERRSPYEDSPFPEGAVLN
jgi:hypothetical protein